MAKIAKGRVVAGGIVAGLVLVGASYCAGKQLMGEWAKLGGKGLMNLSDAAAWWSVAADLVVGLVIAWLYAALRPRLGPGPRTALASGLVAWILAWGYSLVQQVVWMPKVWHNPAIVTALWALAACVVGAWLAGWIYREGGGRARRRR